jgi:hypothetical protein
MFHYIEEDLRWFDQEIPEAVLVWETEQYLAKWANDHEKFDRWLAENELNRRKATDGNNDRER